MGNRRPTKRTFQGRPGFGFIQNKNSEYRLQEPRLPVHSGLVKSPETEASRTCFPCVALYECSTWFHDIALLNKKQQVKSLKPCVEAILRIHQYISVHLSGS